MGCTTCNSKVSGQNHTKNVKFLPENFGENPVMDNLLLKIVVFAIVVAALPIIMAVLVLQVFLTFFTPSYVTKVKDSFNKLFKKIIAKLVKLRYKKEMLKREKQFEGNPDYADINSKELEIDVYFDGENNEEEDK